MFTCWDASVVPAPLLRLLVPLLLVTLRFLLATGAYFTLWSKMTCTSAYVMDSIDKNVKECTSLKGAPKFWRQTEKISLPEHHDQ
jgi:hypothetical protein